MHRSALALALLVAAAASPLAAQQFLDAGTFIISIGGTEAGREEFAIRPTTSRTGTGLLAVSTTRQPGREIQQALELGVDFAPLSYQLTESSGTRVVRRVSVQISGQRVRARLFSADGETAREFPARTPLAILGDGAYSAFYFVPRAEAGTTRALWVVRSTDARLTSATVDVEGADTVAVGGHRLETVRYRLRTADGDERRFWLTPSGDLVQVAIPSSSILATRAELVRR